MSTDTTPTPRELRARADAITEQTKALRKDLLKWHETRLTEVGIARDRAERERYAAEQSAKSAEIHAARSRQAELDAAELREQAAHHARRVVELETQKLDLIKDGSDASEQIDRMEDRARLLDEAARKMMMAATLTGAEPPGSMAEVDERATEIARLEVEAAKALETANDMDIDRTKITKLLPDATFDSEVVQSSTSVDAADTQGAPTESGGDGAGTDAGDGPTDAYELLDTDWLQEFLEEPAPTPDLTDDFADVSVTDSGFDMEPAELTFAEAVSTGADDLFDDDSGMDDLT